VNIKEFYETHNGRPYYDTTVKEISEKLRDQDLQAVAMLISPMRAGARIFAATVEWELYRPHTAANSLMQMIHVLWAKCMWGILIFQADDRSEIDEIAGRHGLHLSDGIPQIFPFENNLGFSSAREKLHPEAQIFPVTNQNLFTLEFSPSEQTRLNSPEALSEKFNEEDRAIRELYRRHGVGEKKVDEILRGRGNDTKTPGDEQRGAAGAVR
jgi:hypothetical protein